MKKKCHTNHKLFKDTCCDGGKYRWSINQYCQKMDNKKVFDVDVYVHRKTNRKTHPQHEIYKFIESYWEFLFIVVVSNDSRHLHNFFQVHNNQQTGHRHFNLVTNYAHKKLYMYATTCTCMFVDTKTLCIQKKNNKTHWILIISIHREIFFVSIAGRDVYYCYEARICP